MTFDISTHQLAFEASADLTFQQKYFIINASVPVGNAALIY